MARVLKGSHSFTCTPHVHPPGVAGMFTATLGLGLWLCWLVCVCVHSRHGCSQDVHCDVRVRVVVVMVGMCVHLRPLYLAGYGRCVSGT